MADTQRTRAAILTLFADNVTGQISPQDLRDFVVTVMNSEFAYTSDFWKGPDPRQLTADRTYRGWVDYSQEIGSTCSYGNLMQMNGSGEWHFASFNGDSLQVAALGVAMESYTQGTSVGVILRKGLYFHSLMSNAWTGSIGKPFVLLSGTAGSMTRTLDQSETVTLGYPVAMNSGGASATSIFEFNPGWGISSE